METTVPPKSLMTTCMPDLFESVYRCASRPSLVFPNTLVFTPGVCDCAVARPSPIVNPINSNTQIPILIYPLLNARLRRRLIFDLRVPSTLYATTRFFSTCRKKLFPYSSRIRNGFDPPKQKNITGDAD